MAESITLRVITPEAVALDTTAEAVNLPGLDGQLGVLNRHAPMVAALGVGELAFGAPGGAKEHLFMAGGFAEVRNNTVRVVCDAAERPTDIDVDRASRAAERARERIRTRESAPDEEFDVLRAEMSLRRALMRISVAQRR